MRLDHNDRLHDEKPEINQKKRGLKMVDIEAVKVI
jgi:hypothetical protein